MDVNSTNYNYRKLIIDNDPPISSIIVNQSITIGYGVVYSISSATYDSLIIKPTMIQKPNGDIIAYGASNSGSFPVCVWKSIDSGQSYTKQGSLVSDSFYIDPNEPGSIAFNGSTYSMVCNKNILYSSDAINWTVGYTASTYPFGKVIWVDNGPSLGGSTSYFYYLNGSTSSYTNVGDGCKVSTNGQTYTNIQSTNTLAQGLVGAVDIIWCDTLNLFVRIGSSFNSDYEKIHWSSDGQNWYRVSGISSINYANWSSAAWSNDLDKVVVVGVKNDSGGATSSFFAVSNDGKSFTTSTSIEHTIYSKFIKYLVKSQEFSLIGVGSDTLYTSKNGVDWNLRTNTAGVNCNANGFNSIIEI